MPSRTSYLLRISGRFRGKIGDIPQNIRGDIDALFARPSDAAGLPEGDTPPAEGYGADWPRGFWLKNYNLCEWTPLADLYESQTDSGADPSEQAQVLVNFRTEVHRAQPGTLHDNHVEILPYVKWFYTYRHYKWHRDLKTKLHVINKRAKEANLLVEPIWFREYQIYCGNGGP
jgi:hypothetical protein